MKLLACVGLVGFGLGLVTPAAGSLETEGPPPAALPRCAGERAAILLSRALQNTGTTSPQVVEMIDAAEQTNFGLDGTRQCAGSLTSRRGQRFTGTWSYTRTSDNGFRVRFALQPAP